MTEAVPPIKVKTAIEKEMPEAQHFKLFIDGEWVDGTTGEEIVVHSPVTGEILGYYPKAGKEDIDRACRDIEIMALQTPFKVLMDMAIDDGIIDSYDVVYEQVVRDLFGGLYGAYGTKNLIAL